MSKQLKDMSREELKSLNRDFKFFYSGTFSQWKRCRFYEDGIMFTTAEQYMMYQKAMLFRDFNIAKEILAVDNPKEVKRLGRLVKGFDEKIWDEHKYQIVKRGNLLKFSQSKNLREELMNTGDRILVEASPFDGIWGVKMSAENASIKDPRNWRGQNLLGFALTEVKEVLINFN